MKRKAIVWLLAVVFAIGTIGGCGSNGSSEPSQAENSAGNNEEMSSEAISGESSEEGDVESGLTAQEQEALDEAQQQVEQLVAENAAE